MSKDIIRDEYVEKVLSALNKVCDTVKVTLGPNGRSVIISENNMTPRCTKDGVTVAKAIELEDASENAIAQLVCEASKTLNTKQGDGTTSCLVFLQEIINKSIYSVRQNEQTNVSEYFNGMDEAIVQITKYIQDNTTSIKGNFNKVKQIAMVSSNGDIKHAEFIAEAFEKIGQSGSVSCHESHSNESTLEIVKGMSLDRGYSSQHFITNKTKQICELDDPVIMIYNEKISSSKNLVKFLESCLQKNKPILIIAEDVSGEALSTLAFNNLRGIIKVCTIKAPGFGDRRIDILEDIAILTGGKVISPDKGDAIENISDWDQFLGSAKTITIGKDSTIIVDGAGDKQDISIRINMLDEQIKSSTSEYDKEKLIERRAKLLAGVAKINVSAPTETELKERKDRVEDAIHATKSAVENGVVIGSGLSIARGALSIKIDKNQHDDFIKGMKVIQSSANAILRQIFDNAYIENPAVVIDNILKNDNKNYGYNVRTRQYCDMYETGVIDPANVVIHIVNVAHSVAKNILQSMVVISERKEEQPTQMPQQPYY